MLIGTLVHEVLERLPSKLTYNAIKNSVSSEMVLKHKLMDLTQGIVDEMYENQALIDFIESFGEDAATVYSDIAWNLEGYVMWYVRSFFMHIRAGKTPYQAHDYLKPKKAELEIVVDTDLEIKRRQSMPIPVKLKGIIDCVQLMTRNEEAIAKVDTGLVDYKTSKTYDLAIDSDYELQMEFYAMLWEEKFGNLPDWCAVLYLKPMMLSKMRPAKNCGELIMAKVKHMVKSVQSRLYPGNPSYKWCDKKWCDWWDRCNQEGRYDGTKVTGDRDPNFNR